MEQVINETTKENYNFSHLSFLDDDKDRALCAICVFLNERKNSVRKQIQTYFQTVRKCELHRYSIISKTSSSYNKNARYIEEWYQKVMERLNRIFDEFVIINATTIQYGNHNRGNLTICKYGITDAFKNSIWIHTNSLKEFLNELPNDMPFQEEGKEYCLLLNNFYKLVSNYHK